ncbi:hypothetical protein IV203_026752 [Nitzschia inconspicua]|uniref:Uncharacterized protein n=1 Tax=Nitzschia inconspicua TaxID=303405 RepID=A0A9K3LJU1_9STRA|nr:hypothetical protein IV203_026735 [Nitzschia inconspicua]KAG7363379.1 hypothetical protein IV203_026739 [Nitzschia inconspicua]KAG7363383.1 hypothetical protein IV203_026743 [Nitzschia inconspicua]KAG7363387.1 hypothetical protein IV203_026747 [Nitzschia inconspicua]KAG7363392.1 hypothetical protein IV203_026752 [Nitzschia inconspicua]
MDARAMIEEEDDVAMSKTSIQEHLQDHEDHPALMAGYQKERSGDRVQFRSRNSIEEVRRISRISNYDIEEIISYWGDSDEHILRKEELKKAAHDMQYCRRMSDNSTFTSLGIADKVGERRVIKKQNREIATRAVLDEQDLQDCEGVYDDELLADVYALTTATAKREAKASAKALHEEVKQF